MPLTLDLPAALLTRLGAQARPDETTDATVIRVLDAGLRQIEARQRGARATNAKLYGTPERRAAAGQRLLAARLAKRRLA